MPGVARPRPPQGRCPTPRLPQPSPELRGVVDRLQARFGQQQRDSASQERDALDWLLSSERQRKAVPPRALQRQLAAMLPRPARANEVTSEQTLTSRRATIVDVLLRTGDAQALLQAWRFLGSPRRDAITARLARHVRTRGRGPRHWRRAVAWLPAEPTELVAALHDPAAWFAANHAHTTLGAVLTALRGGRGLEWVEARCLAAYAQTRPLADWRREHPDATAEAMRLRPPPLIGPLLSQLLVAHGRRDVRRPARVLSNLSASPALRRLVLRFERNDLMGPLLQRGAHAVAEPWLTHMSVEARRVAHLVWLRDEVGRILERFEDRSGRRARALLAIAGAYPV